jgi:hypothetical protein
MDPQPVTHRARKCPEFPILHNYEAVPDKNFWLSYPSEKIPSVINSHINIESFKKEIANLKSHLTETEWSKAQKCISYLSFRAPSFYINDLGPCLAKNFKDAFKYSQ